MQTTPLALLSFLQEAAPTTTSAAPGFMNWIPIVLVLVIFYFVLIMPERKKQKQRQKMLDALSKGDRVMTSGGLYGTVVQVTNEIVTLQVADEVRMRFSRAAIQTVIADEGAKAVAEVPSKA